MVGKATVVVASSYSDVRSTANPMGGSGRALSEDEGWWPRSIRARRDRSPKGRWLSGLLACFFLFASLIALYEVRSLPRPSSGEADSIGAIQTVRAFYVALDEFMAAGDASAVSKILAPGALAFEPELGAMGDGSGLLTYLLALRSTYPKLRYSVDRIDAGENLAIASVRRTGIADGGPNAAWLSGSGTSHEFFRVRDGRIVQHWTTAPSSVLLHNLNVSPTSIEVTQPGHLAIAELLFSPGQYDPQPIDGPALVLVQRGRLTLIGNSSSQIVDLATGDTVVPGPNERATAEPGQAIFIPEFRAFVRNSDPEPVGALLATLADDPRQIRETIPGDPRPSHSVINDWSMLSQDRATTYGSVIVRPRAIDERSIPTGTWELEVAWAVLGPGSSLPLAGDGEWAIADVISASASPVTQSQLADGTVPALTNVGDEPVAALVLRVRPAN